MRLNAYVLLADPVWLTASVESYYEHVDRIVACYDEDAIGWNGQPIDVDVCVERMRALDHDEKVVFLPGKFHGPGWAGMDGDTRQRQIALDVAGVGADWVLQIDTDEIVPRFDLVSRGIEDTSRADLSACWFPQRWLYARVGNRWFFENARRRVLSAASYPGPIAVRPGVQLVHGRQDMSPRVLIGFSGKGGLPKRHAIIHLAWVRSPAQMVVKSRLSGHAEDFDWPRAIDDWGDAHTRPLRFAARNFFRPVHRHFRLMRVPIRLPEDPLCIWTRRGSYRRTIESQLVDHATIARTTEREQGAVR
jgi:hypothetical protein